MEGELGLELAGFGFGCRRSAVDLSGQEGNGSSDGEGLHGDWVKSWTLNKICCIRAGVKDEWKEIIL